MSARAATSRQPSRAQVEAAKRIYEEACSSGSEDSDQGPEAKEEARPRPAKSSAKSSGMNKCWIFTVYMQDGKWVEPWPAKNTRYDVLERKRGHAPAPAVVKYCCYQQETCPTTKREHIQGYCQFGKCT
jgi:hypothetical protein